MSYWYTSSQAQDSSAQTSRARATKGFPTIPDPVVWAQTRFHWQPDPIQADILRTSATRLMLCCTRQWGKSTVTAIKALHHAWHYPGSLVIVGAPTARQSGEWIDKTSTLLRQLDVTPRGDGRNRNSLLLPNRSRIVGLPGVAANIRGFSRVSLLILDEAAFVPDSLYHALNPMLAVSGGALWLMSTPNGQSGFFYNEWHSTESTWLRTQVPAHRCARIAPEFLAGQRIALGDQIYRQKYQCEFLSTGSQVFSQELLHQSFDDLYDPINGGQPLWRDLPRGDN
jgi:hypothetical protein